MKSVTFEFRAVAAVVALFCAGYPVLAQPTEPGEPTHIEIIGKPTAARPPVPDGSKPIDADHVPTICTQAEYDAGASIYEPSYGYYFSKVAKAWLPRPRCYPRWGFLVMSPSQLVKAGKAVTMIAIPVDGSNSGEYAPQENAIHWDFFSGAKVVSGCGSADLTCTVIPVPADSKYNDWRWFQFHVSMPKTYYIDDPGEFCGGQHLCPGATTNAWGFVGVVPDDFNTEIFGHVTASVCTEDSCKLKPLAGVDVSAESEGGDILHALTDAKGAYSLLVKKGEYTVTPTSGSDSFSPEFEKVVVVNGKAGPVDFSTCGDGSRSATRQVSLDGKLLRCHLFSATVSPSVRPDAAFNLNLKLDKWERDRGDISIIEGKTRLLTKLTPTGGVQRKKIGVAYWPRHDGKSREKACLMKLTALQDDIDRNVTVFGSAIASETISNRWPMAL